MASLAFVLCFPILAQTGSPSAKTPLTKVIGEVEAIDSGARKATVHTDAGAEWSVALTDKTVYLRVAPGEKDLKKAARIAVKDLAVGDRVLARGAAGADSNSVVAASVIVMTKEDLAQKHEQDREEWLRRGVIGVVTSVDPATKEITVTSRALQGSKAIVVETTAATKFRRYAPDSVRFRDAKPSELASIRPGDQLRALGDRDEAGDRLKAEEVVSGTFRTLAGVVIFVDPASNTVRINDLATKKPVTVHVNPDTMIRRLPEMMATMMAHRLQAATGGAAGARGGSAGPGGAGRPTGAGGAGGAGGGQGIQPGGAQGGPGHPGAGGGNRPFDLQQMLEHLPPVTLADLKKGDALIISGTEGANPADVTAIALVGGVGPFLAAAPRMGNGQTNLGMWNLDIGLPVE